MKITFKLLLLIIIGSELNATEPIFFSTWGKLLHSEISLENNKNFYISGTQNKTRELKASLKALQSDRAQAWACQFPARYLLISENYNVKKIDLTLCEGLHEFINKVPFDTVTLVYTSENLKNPSSSLGHSLLKVSGTNYKNTPVEHAFSFFTLLDDVFFTSLIYQSFFSGKEGYYTLTPYDKYRNLYLFEQKRNIWEYEIELSGYQKQLLSYHLYELKKVNFEYLFHLYNCSTFIARIFSVLWPDNFYKKDAFVSPRDLISYAKDLPHTVKNNYSNKWFVNSLMSSLNFTSKDIKKIKNLDFSTSSHSVKDEFTYLKLGKAYLGLMYEDGKIDRSLWSKKNKIIADRLKQEKYSQFNVEPATRVNPINRPADSQIGMSYKSYRNTKIDIYNISFMAASHLLGQNLSSFSYESEVKMFHIGGAYESFSETLTLDFLDLFAVKSYPVHNPLTGGVSWEASVGYKLFYDLRDDLQAKRSPYISAMIGKSYGLIRDIDVNLMIGADLYYNKKPRARDRLQLGFILREIYNMKSILNLGYQDAFVDPTLSVYFQHNINFTSYNINFSYEKLKSGQRQEDIYSLGLVWLY